MKTEKFPRENPTRERTDFPMTDVMEVPTLPNDIPNSGIIIGPEPLDEDNLPGSQPLHDDIEFPKPHLNS